MFLVALENSLFVSLVAVLPVVALVVVGLTFLSVNLDPFFPSWASFSLSYLDCYLSDDSMDAGAHLASLMMSLHYSAVDVMAASQFSQSERGVSSLVSERTFVGFPAVGLAAVLLVDAAMFSSHDRDAVAAPSASVYVSCSLVAALETARRLYGVVIRA